MSTKYLLCTMMIILSIMTVFCFYDDNTTIKGQLPHTFTQTAHITHNGMAHGAAVGADGTIFLASDGLRAYSYDETSFTNTAHIDNVGYARGVAVGADGTIFLAAGEDGLCAYTYSGYLGVENELSSIPGKYELFQNYPNPFNPVSTIR